MGKKKNARRNPGITWEELQEAVQFRARINTHGGEYDIVQSGKRGSHWVLRSANGLRYSMFVNNNGEVDAPVLYL